jgi:hypothetical protein
MAEMRVSRRVGSVFCCRFAAGLCRLFQGFRTRPAYTLEL